MATEAITRDNTFIFLGDIVPYKDTTSRVARAKVESFEDGRNGVSCWRGTDVKTGEKVFCSVDLTFDLIDEGHTKN